MRNPPKQINKVNKLVRVVVHAQKRNPLSDLYKILQRGRYPRPNHLCKFWCLRVAGVKFLHSA